jgi:ATP-dependent RNA helicase RhlE
MGFEELGLSDKVMEGVRNAGYETPTPIQAQSIPLGIEGKDVVGASQTGTGKTAAFALPILHRLDSHGDLRCLILEPVRELASQVLDNFETLGKGTDLRSLLIHGGVGYGKQLDGLEAGVDILIATPGRLLDLMEKGAIKLDKIEVLVLDEVDRMLDMGFLPDV